MGFPLELELRLDTLSFVFLTLITFLMPVVILISCKNIKKNIKFYLIQSIETRILKVGDLIIIKEE